MVYVHLHSLFRHIQACSDIYTLHSSFVNKFLRFYRDLVDTGQVLYNRRIITTVR